MLLVNGETQERARR